MDSSTCTAMDKEVVIGADKPNSQDTEITTKKRKRSEFESDIMRISITDNEEPKTYLVHREILCQESPYFAALANFKEGEENHVSFVDMDHLAFETVLHWLYKGDLHPDINDEPYILMRAWAIADRFLMNKCKNLVMDKLRHIHTEIHAVAVDIAVVDVLDYNTQSTLTQYILDQVSYDCVVNKAFDRDPDTEEDVQGLSVELSYALLRRIVTTAQGWHMSKQHRTAKPKDPASLVGCVYHDHVEGEECYLKSKDNMA